MEQKNNIALEWITERRKVKDLVPFEFNPRKITEEKINKLRESVAHFNLVEIPAINKDDTIIAGHQRLKVLIAMGRGDEEIDVRVPNRMLTDIELKEYNLRSNIQVGMWDLEILQEVFSEFDLEGLGLDITDLPDFKAEMLNDEEQELEFDDTPPLEPITLNGDIYEFHSLDKNLKHRLMCGNSRLNEDVLKLMNGRKAVMIFTDPPYNVKVNEIVNLGKKKHKEFKEASGEMSEEEFIQFLKDVFVNLINYSIDGSIHYICMDWKHIFEIVNAAKPLFGKQKQLAIWNKDNAGMGSFYRSKHELVFIFKNGKEKHINNFELGQTGRYRTNVWDYPGANSFAGKTDINEDHPTPKPLEMVADAILDVSNKFDAVLDLFEGSGTTQISCEKTSRNSYGMDLDTAYCDVTVRRWIKYMRDNNRAFKVLRNDRELVEAELESYFEK